MAATQTTRLQVYVWTSGDDPFNRDQLDTSHASLEERAAVFLPTGTLSARPVAGPSNARGFYLATDQNSPVGILYYSDGTSWHALNQFGTAGTSTPGDTASAGTALTAARSDHRHAMPAYAVTTAAVSTAAAAGSANTFARGDHVHGIAAGAVTAGRIAAGGVSANNQLADGIVDARVLAAGAVTAGKIAVGGVSATNQLANEIITGEKIAAGTITGDKLASGAVLFEGVVGPNELQDGAVVAGKIAAGGVSANNQLADSTVDSRVLALSSVTAGRVAVGGVSASNQIANGVVGSDQLADGAVTGVKLAADQRMPVGSITMFVGASAPSGWLFCDGSQIAASSALGLLLGSAFNTGGESPGFVRLPDFRGRVPVGLNTSQTQFDQVGERGGAVDHVLSTAELPAHSHGLANHVHSLNNHTHTAGSHTHSLSSHTHSLNNHTHPVPDHSHTVTVNAANISHTHASAGTETDALVSRRTSYASGGTNFNVASAAVGAGIQMRYDSATGSGGSTAHNHTTSVSGGATTTQGASGSTGTPSNDVTGTPSGSSDTGAASGNTGSATGSTANEGSGSAHNNLQPYLVVNYIIKQ